MSDRPPLLAPLRVTTVRDGRKVAETEGAAAITSALARDQLIALLGESFTALLRGELPSREACLYLGGALRGFLEDGGDLVRDHLGIIRPSSHETVQKIWARLSATERAPRQDRVASGASKRKGEPR